MSSSPFYAHSSGDSDRSRWQPLPEHLQNVGALASDRAAIFGASAMARAMGELHDLGKFCQEFQDRLDGDPHRVDHSTWGARIAVEKWGPIGLLLAYGIAGHHAGLANGAGDGQRTPLADRLATQDLPVLDPGWREHVTLPSRIEDPGLKPNGQLRQFQFAFLARMLFSCLVDADFLDTEAYYQRLEGKRDWRAASAAPSLMALREHMDEYLGRLRSSSPLAQTRSQILKHVRGLAQEEPGLFSLSVPTGGGKTLTSLAFAIDHALRHGLRRVVFVIPFTSVVEQNAAVFRRALGELGDAAVLEHHSAFHERVPAPDDPDAYQAAQKLKLAMENWDAPIVVTTAVQFFESLFAARPSQCRKLHAIAGSVVVLDEVQTLPLDLLLPCVAAIDELARNYRTSIVLCTATQPALQAPSFTGGLVGVRELAPDVPALYRALERVRVRHIGTLDDSALKDELTRREQVLCIVNNRRHARVLFAAIRDFPGAIHLTTLMCAAHRSEVLQKVRELLKTGKPCRVVATSLIEAGVDVDFATVLRAEAGLDAIAQAAGRCNREGSREIEASEVLVFASGNPDWAPPSALLPFAQAGREVLNRYKDDPIGPEAIRAYFELLYWQQGEDRMDKHGLLALLKQSRVESLPLETLAEKFRMIDDAQAPILIPYDETARKALDQLEFATGAVGLARRLQRYTVQVRPSVRSELIKVGAVRFVRPQQWGEQFAVLADESLYDVDVGLRWDQPAMVAADKLMW